MNSTLKTVLGLSAAIVMTGAAAGVLAQDGPPGVPPSVGFGQGGPGGPGGRGGPPSPEMRAQMLTERLNLRPDQQAALQTFLQASQPPQRGQLRAQRQMTTPERLDQQLAEMRQRVDATKRFYAQLTPEQKQTFDSTPMLAMGPDGGRPGGRGGRRGQGGPGQPGFGGPNQGFGAPPQ